MNFKALYNPAREEGAEWYQIFLAERLAGEAGGEGELFFFLLSLFKENESGHLRIELKEEEGELLSRYSSFFRSSLSPFVITEDGRFLYTKRRKAQEDRFIELLNALLSRRPEPLVSDLDRFWDQASEGIEPPLTPEVMNGCRQVNGRAFYIITGGPGTGKTTALSGIIRVLNRASELAGRPAPRMALAAPTGRAAKRMEQSLGARGIAGTARTLHKLLGISFDKGTPRFDRENPLPADLIVVDEASMIDLRMMTLLFDALPPGGHLLLVGDKDQLPSVEAGALFSDFLYRSEEPGHRMGDRILMLRNVYRSHRDIITLAGHIIEGRKEDALAFLKNEAGGDMVQYRHLPEKAESLYREITAFYRSGQPRQTDGFPWPVSRWEEGRKELDRWFEFYNERIILCPSRKGLMGVERLNREIRDRLFSRSLHGIPLMMTSNDYELDLYNGDRGILFLLAGEPHVFFADGENYRHIPLAYLEEWEYSWVQTIHKSQGSEFREVSVILPEGAERLLSREILYTALTRAKEKVSLYSSDETVKLCIGRGVYRSSRIKEVLSADPSPA